LVLLLYIVSGGTYFIRDFLLRLHLGYFCSLFLPDFIRYALKQLRISESVKNVYYLTDEVYYSTNRGFTSQKI